jgi:hypothetical protein
MPYTSTSIEKLVTPSDNIIEGFIPGRTYTLLISNHGTSTVQLKVANPIGVQAVLESESSADWDDVIDMPGDRLIIDYVSGTDSVQVVATLKPLR